MESSADDPVREVYRQIDRFNQQAWALSDTDADQAYALAEQAYALAAEPYGGAQADLVGTAGSLRTLGYLNMRGGRHTQGIGQLARSLAILQMLPGVGEAKGDVDDVSDAANERGAWPEDWAGTLADVYDGLAAIYAQSGSYPEGLDLIHKQLAAATAIGDMPRVANALNNLGAIYLAMEQPQRAIETLQRNLELSTELGYARILCLSYLNLAEMYLITGDYAAASDHGVRGLQACQAGGFALFEVYARKTLGKLHRMCGEMEESLRWLREAQADARDMQSHMLDIAIQLELGQTLAAAGSEREAREALWEAAQLAEAVDAASELYEAHRLLAEVCEQMGDTSAALAHYKRFQEVKERVTGEKVSQRLQVLQVVHDTELARKQAEQLQSLNDQLEQQVANRTAELTATVVLLQEEIVQRQRAEAEVGAMVATLEQRVAARTEELATFFDLTLLAGQGRGMEGVLANLLPRLVEVTRSRVICVHLRDPQDAALRLAGQQSLSRPAQAALQTVALEGEFLRWMSRAGDPLITTDLLAAPGLPAAFRLPDYQTYLGVQIKIGGRSEGLLSCYRATARGYGLDEVALVTALAEQIGMMLEIQRLRRHAEETAVLAERQRLARDLHDSVTQSLYSLTLFSRAGREAAADGDAARLHTSLTELERNTLHALREMRLLLYELRPADLESEGLSRALELRLNTVERRAGLKLDVHIEHLPSLFPAFELDLYHIIVEALNNVVKHASASRVRLRMGVADGCLRLSIADDGGGFDPQITSGGLGLRNMRERVAGLNGEIVITSALGEGTTIEAMIPCLGEVQ
jgi:signal transduction histidine kinase